MNPFTRTNDFVTAKARSPTFKKLTAFFQSTSALIGVVILTAMIVMSLAAPWVVPQNPYDLLHLDIMEGSLPPGSINQVEGFTYLLGTDEQGRDIWSAIIYGLRISLGVGAAATIIACLLGGVVGVVSAFVGGRTDSLVMRFVDLQLSFPPILIALVLLSLFGRGIDKVIIALVAVQWAYYARTARSSALVEMRRGYVEAAKCLRLPSSRIVIHHLLPNSLPPLLVVATIQIGHAIGLEATLSFLGVGVPVTEPSLGMLIANGYQYMLSGNYWISTFPGIALVLAILAINLVADQLRKVLNPRVSG